MQTQRSGHFCHSPATSWGRGEKNQEYNFPPQSRSWRLVGRLNPHVRAVSTLNDGSVCPEERDFQAARKHKQLGKVSPADLLPGKNRTQNCNSFPNTAPNKVCLMKKASELCCHPQLYLRPWIIPQKEKLMITMCYLQYSKPKRY